METLECLNMTMTVTSKILKYIELQENSLTFPASYYRAAIPLERPVYARMTQMPSIDSGIQPTSSGDRYLSELLHITSRAVLFEGQICMCHDGCIRITLDSYFELLSLISTVIIAIGGLPTFNGPHEKQVPARLVDAHT